MLKIVLTLAKNYVVNPFIYRYRYLFLGLILLLVVSSIGILLSPQEKQMAIVEGTKSILHDLGLGHREIVGLLSASTLLVIIYMLFRGGLFIVVAEEAEYELLLSQPIGLRTYFAGKALSLILQYVMYSVLYVTAIPIVLLFTKDVFKAILTPIILGLTLSFFPLTRLLVDIIRTITREHRLSKAVDTCIIAYVLLGLLHSYHTSTISPILSLPLRPIFETIYYLLTREPLITVLQNATLMVVELSVIVIAITVLAGRLSPESIKPLYLVARDRLLWSLRYASRIVFRGGLRKTTYKVVIGLTHLSNTHILLYTLSMVAAIIISYMARILVYRYFNPMILEFTSIFLTPFILSIAASGIVNILLANDLAYLWIHRVYAIDTKPLAEALIIKYTISLTEALLVVAVVDTVLSGNLISLLLPVIALPAIVLTAPIVLFVALRFAAKRRVVRQAMIGLYVVEDVVMMMLWSIIVMVFLALTVAFNSVKQLITPHTILVLLPISAITSIIIGYISSRILASYTSKVNIMI